MPVLTETHPALAADWVTTEDGKTPSDVSQGSAYRATWRCGTCQHTWTAVVYSRTRGSGCPNCTKTAISGRRSAPKPGTSLAEAYPHIALDYDPDLNPLTPRDVAAHSRLKAHWRCPEGHTWTATVHNRTRNDGTGNGCPKCFAARHSQHMRRPRARRALVVADPTMAMDWDFASPLNLGVSPSDVSHKSGVDRGWCCRTCGYRWVASPANRARGYGCAPCQRGHGSLQESAVLAAVRTLDPDAGAGRVRRRLAGSARPWKVDAVSESLKLIVEFDGSYWHSEAANPGSFKRDQDKAEDLRSQGWTVCRIREAPLPPTGSLDLVVPFGCMGDALTGVVLAHLRTFLRSR